MEVETTRATRTQQQYEPRDNRSKEEKNSVDDCNADGIPNESFGDDDYVCTFKSEQTSPESTYKQVKSAPEFKRAVQIFEAYRRNKFVCQAPQCFGRHLKEPVGSCACGYFHSQCCQNKENYRLICSMCKKTLKKAEVKDMIVAVLQDQTSTLRRFMEWLEYFEQGLRHCLNDAEFWKQRTIHVVDAEKFLSAVYGIAVLKRDYGDGELDQRGRELRRRFEKSFEPVDFTAVNDLRTNVTCFLRAVALQDETMVVSAENRTSSLFAFFQKWLHRNNAPSTTYVSKGVTKPLTDNGFAQAIREVTKGEEFSWMKRGEEKKRIAETFAWDAEYNILIRVPTKPKEKIRGYVGVMIKPDWKE